MNTVRRSAREVALLVLFWADLQEGEQPDEVLESFKRDLLGDDEFLAELFEVSNDAGTLRKRARSSQNQNNSGLLWSELSLVLPHICAPSMR